MNRGRNHVDVPTASSFVNVIGFTVPLISLASSPPTAPRFEFFQNGSDEPQRVTIEHSPFSIGRCETSDLRIDSAQVSREHAQLYQRGNIWTIRDLGSTNGTQVNGKLVRESFLSDGDILAIAETELTFVASSVTPFQRMATQPIQSREVVKAPAMLAAEIAKIRALTEATLWQAIPLQMANIASLKTGEIEACLALSAEKAGLADHDLQFNALPAVGRHYRELARRRTVEIAQTEPAVNRIFVFADIAEFESREALFGGLEQLRELLPLDCELGVNFLLPSVLDFAAVSEVCSAVRKAGLLLGFIDFQGSSGQVLELESCAPDYLLLSDKMLTGVTAGSQPLRRLELVLNTCQQLCIKPVLPHCACHRTIELCRQLGYEFAVQFNVPQVNAARQPVVAFAS